MPDFKTGGDMPEQAKMAAMGEDTLF